MDKKCKYKQTTKSVTDIPERRNINTKKEKRLNEMKSWDGIHCDWWYHHCSKDFGGIESKSLHPSRLSCFSFIKCRLTKFIKQTFVKDSILASHNSPCFLQRMRWFGSLSKLDRGKCQLGHTIL